MKIIVIDIGGTSIKYASYEDDRLCHFSECDTEAWKGGDHVIQRAIGIVERMSPCDAIGVCTTGMVDIEKGCVRYAKSSMPDYTGTEIKGILEKKFQVPVIVENDVNAAALGEGYFGAAKEFSSYLCLTFGTGVGGAIVNEGKIIRGISGFAGEFGSMIIHEGETDDSRFLKGSYENYASTSALMQKVREIMPEIVDGRQIFEKIQDPEIRRIVDCWIQEISYGLVTLIHIFNPECVVLGGGVMEQKYVVENIKRVVHQQIMPVFRKVRITAASLGNKGGLYGVAYLAREQSRSLYADTGIVSW